MGVEKKPPHPATVVQRKAPHPAMVAQRKAPHPAMVTQPRELPKPGAHLPHPATVAQRRAAPVATSRPPHPATAPRASSAGGEAAQPMLERIKSGYGYIASTLGGVSGGIVSGVGYGLMASNPIGWLVGGLLAGTTIGAGVAYYRGSDGGDGEEDVPEVVDEPKSQTVRGPTKDSQWRELQEARGEYETKLQKISKTLSSMRGTLVDMRTLSRKLMARQPLLKEIADSKRVSSKQLDEWRGGMERATLRAAARKGEDAIKAYAKFLDLLEDFQSRKALDRVSKKEFYKYLGLTWRKEEMAEDLGVWQTQLEKLLDEQDRVATSLEARDREETVIHQALRLWRSAPPEIIEAEAPVSRGRSTYLDDTYPDGWVHIHGNAYAAITPAVKDLLSSKEGALGMFQDALGNGSIADYGTGESGVKWSKSELKVRRTRLEAIAMRGDTRLTGDIRVVPARESGFDRDIRVLEFSRMIYGH